MDGHVLPITSTPSEGAASKQPSPPLVTLKTIFEQVGVAHDMPRKQTDGFLADFVAAMTEHLRSGARVRMAASVRWRSDRVLR
jgi:hypothetical protein